MILLCCKTRTITQFIPEIFFYTVVPTDLGLLTPAADNSAGEDLLPAAWPLDADSKAAFKNQLVCVKTQA